MPSKRLISTLLEIVYTPESAIKHPIKLLKQMWCDLLVSRELAWQLTVRDISAQYRQSFFNIAWAFISLIVLTAGFTLASNVNVINIGNTNTPYPAYAMFSTALC